jgi:hypothetical protein
VLAKGLGLTAETEFDNNKMSSEHEKASREGAKPRNELDGSERMLKNLVRKRSE